MLAKHLIRLGAVRPDLRPHIRPILASLSTRRAKSMEDVDLKPPKGAREDAQKGLDYRREYGRGGTPVGIARARDIANGRNLSPETLYRMKAFFDRHEKNRRPPTVKKESDGGPTNGWIAWLLWGGDPARAWAEKKVRELDRVREENEN